MFHTISWQSYWLTLALLLAGYYLAIYLLYYRSDFKIGLSRKSLGNSLSSPVPSNNREMQTDTMLQPSLFDKIEAPLLPTAVVSTEEYLAEYCMDELSAFFEEARSRRWVHEELIMALQSILRKYPALKSSSYKEPLSNVIVTQSENFCSLHLGREDMVRVWLES
jgi:hypothetical protein